MTIRGYINDGYTEKGYIAESPRLYPALRFEFRPVSQRAQFEYAKAGDTMKDFQFREYEAALVRRHLVSWDLRDQSDKVVPITEESLLRMKGVQFIRLLRIVLTHEAPDSDPLATEQADGDTADVLMEAVRSGRPVAEVRQEHDAKN